ncbi:MAG: hypothetical protein J6Y05_10155 [Bacteroidales bacterium]|nr:hypothetical protein [Bacteroidales bacterium]
MAVAPAITPADGTTGIRSILSTPYLFNCVDVNNGSAQLLRLRVSIISSR